MCDLRAQRSVCVGVGGQEGFDKAIGLDKVRLNSGSERLGEMFEEEFEGEEGDGFNE